MLEVLAEVRVRKTDRLNNGVAHDLAQLGKRECDVMHGDIPSCASEFLLRDYNTVFASFIKLHH